MKELAASAAARNCTLGVMETATGTRATGLPGEEQDTAQRETENGNVTRQLKV